MHEPIYKTDTKIEAKRLQSYKIFMGSIREKFNIDIAILEKLIN